MFIVALLGLVVKLIELSRKEPSAGSRCWNAGGPTGFEPGRWNTRAQEVIDCTGIDCSP